MKLLLRILTTAILTLAFIFTVVRWAAWVTLTFWEVRKVPPVARIVPTNLRDQTISQASGKKLSYVGYEFEVPWTDLDEGKTIQYPKDKPDKTTVLLAFHSGLRLRVAAFSTGEWRTLFTTDWKLSPREFELFAGQDAAMSDYVFVRNLYEFTPGKMHYWAWPSAVHAHEAMVLMIKSAATSKEAETGIFSVQNEGFKGFQQGSPLARPARLLVTLYSDSGGVEVEFWQKDDKSPAGVTQPEINRIVQSLHKIPVSEIAISAR